MRKRERDKKGKGGESREEMKEMGRRELGDERREGGRGNGERRNNSARYGARCVCGCVMLGIYKMKSKEGGGKHIDSLILFINILHLEAIETDMEETE